MLKQIFENDSVTINHDENNNTTEIKWKRTCGNILDETHTQLFNEIEELIKRVAPQKLLANMSECSYLITPDTGPWHKNPLFKMFSDLPPTRIAVVIPQNLFVNSSFDAARASEKTDANKKFNYFDNVQNAWDWLKN